MKKANELSDEQEKVVERVRAAVARGKDLSEEEQRRLVDKQTFPVGIKEDGTLNEGAEKNPDLGL